MHTGPGPEPRPALDQLVAHIADLKARRNANWSDMERRTGVTRQAFGAAAQGRQPGGRVWAIPSESTIIALDRGLRAGGSVFAAWVQAKREDEEIQLARVAARAFPGMSGLPPLPGRTVDRTGEVRATDRRQLIGGMAVAGVLGDIGEVDNAFRVGRPPVADLAQVEEALKTLERDRCSTDPAVLFPPAREAWKSANRLLRSAVEAKHVTRLNLLAGRLAAGLAGVSQFGGRTDLARAFAGIAEQHAAAAVEEPHGSLADARAFRARVAGLQSWMALDVGTPGAAADIAARGLLEAAPPDRARLAGYGAEAAAVSGDHYRAEEAVAVMLASRRAADSPDAALPWDDVEEQLYIALPASWAPGRGKVAITHGIQATGCSCACQGQALAHLAIGRGHLDGDRPAPDAAASAGIAALDTIAEAPNATVTHGAADLLLRLRPYTTEPLVQELGRRVAAV